jgi:EmrB/QacA subfamily drug resistance transporter
MTLTADRRTPATIAAATAASTTGTRIAADPGTAPHANPQADYQSEGHPRRWLVLPVILTAMFMAMFDSIASSSTYSKARRKSTGPAVGRVESVAAPTARPVRSPVRSGPAGGIATVNKQKIEPSASFAQDGQEPYPQRWKMLPVLLSAMGMAMFDFFVVNVAGPSIESSLHASSAGLELVISGYTFTYAAAMVLGGRLGDLVGRRPMFLWGMTAFTAASALCGVAPTSGTLITARLLQGLTAAAMVPQVLAMITAVFPPHERARALGYFGLTIGLGSVAGQVLGGVLLNVDLFGWGWRTIFLVNVPVGVAMVVLGMRLLPSTVKAARPKFDIPGTIGIASGIGLLLVPLVLGRDEHWPAWTLVSFAASVPVLAATLWWERRLTVRGGAPMVTMDLFKDRGYAAGFAIGSLYLGTFTGFLLALTFLLQGGLHLSPLAAGLTFGPLGLAFAASSILGKGVAGRHPGRTATAGVLTSLTGMGSLTIVLSIVGSSLPSWAVIPSMMLVGAGNGLAIPTLIGASLHRVPAHHAGSGAGLLQTGQQFGNAAGVAVMGAVFFAILGTGAHKADFVDATAMVVGLSAAVLAVLVGLTFLLPRTLNHTATLVEDHLVRTNLIGESRAV